MLNQSDPAMRGYFLAAMAGEELVVGWFTRQLDRISEPNGFEWKLRDGGQLSCTKSSTSSSRRCSHRPDDPARERPTLLRAMARGPPADQRLSAGYLCLPRGERLLAAAIASGWPAPYLGVRIATHRVGEQRVRGIVGVRVHDYIHGAPEGV